MKNIKIYFLIFFSIIVASCAYDNYEAPDSKLEGRLVYEGTPLNLDYSDVYLQIWEPGWKKKNRIDLHVDQHGHFSAVLFNGTYKVVSQVNVHPYKVNINDQTNADTVLVELHGNENLDIEVTPFYLVKNATITNTGKAVNATVALDKIITDADQKDVERVSLYLSKSNLVGPKSDVGSTGNAWQVNSPADINNIILSREIPDLRPSAQTFVYARIGVKLTNVTTMIYSEPQKIEF